MVRPSDFRPNGSRPTVVAPLRGHSIKQLSIVTKWIRRDEERKIELISCWWLSRQNPRSVAFNQIDGMNKSIPLEKGGGGACKYHRLLLFY